MVVAQIIHGGFSQIIAREKNDSNVEIGELLISESSKGKFLLQVVDIVYSSQLSRQNLELISGIRLEDDENIDFLDPSVRNYNLLILKNLLYIKDDKAYTSKFLPSFFSDLRRIKEEDLKFLKGSGDLYLGNVRSGSKILDSDFALPSKKILSHHVLVAAQTGKGKSNLTKTLIERALNNKNFSMLVLDPHDEYFGRSSFGLKDSKYNKNLKYYSTTNITSSLFSKLYFSIKDLKPEHFQGVLNFTEAQSEAVSFFYKKFKEDWIKELLLFDVESKSETNKIFKPETLNVLKRKISGVLNINYDVKNNILEYKNVFTEEKSVLKNILEELESSKIVIIDTSSFSGSLEILIGSIIANKLFDKYKYYKSQGILEEKPVVSIVLEEAPRVLGKNALQSNTNVFEKIAREGRKFNVGLFAITQVPSLIQKEILSNMNTKIILGLEMSVERNAIIESASQDISDLNKTIASLEKGEAIITSSFSKFAVPIKTPLFESVIKKHLEEKEEKNKILENKNFEF